LPSKHDVFKITACTGELILAFFPRDKVHGVAPPVGCGFSGPWPGAQHEALELYEELLDWLKIGALGKKEEELRSGFSDDLPCGFALLRISPENWAVSQSG
jgi:hypothetical protein